MAKHEFGGEWTADKLERVRKYLQAYTTIFHGNPKAHHFTTIYVDGFAGTGSRVDANLVGSGDAQLFESIPDPETEAYKKGSSRIALETEPAFQRYIFIERAAQHVSDLRQLVSEFPHRRAQIVDGEANAFLRQWCASTNWRRNRAVVFLDPYGMQVEWTTIEAIGRTKAIDLWLLFPLGVAINRLLTRGSPPPGGWADALTRIFGTPDWRSAFYTTHENQTLFGLESEERKEADWQQIGQFFVDRLKSVFEQVAENPLPLRNSTHTPIYLLCFAAGNPKGARTAVKIAQDILRP